MKLRIIPTSEGYFDAITNQYIYNYTDHLGNIRLSYTDTNKDGIIQPRQYFVSKCDGNWNPPFEFPTCIDYWKPGEIVEVNNYYPFGLMHNYTATTQNAYQYKYNGKELQETEMYDYGARFYMPDIGRWGVIDPMAEKYRRWSPYNYAINNPIMFIDPDGRDVTFSGAAAISFGAFLIGQAKAYNAANAERTDEISFFSETGDENDGSLSSGMQANIGKGSPPFIFMIGGADLAFGLMGKSDTTLNVENVLKKSGMFVSSSNHDYFGSNKNVTQELADYVAAQYSILKSDVILYGYSRGGVEVMEVARLLEKQNIPIKLMVLLDAANGPYSNKVNRVISGNVQNVINYYQTDSKSNKLGSIGGPAIKARNSNTSIQNYNVTGSYFFPGGSKTSSPINHSNIDEAYRDVVLYNILKYRK